MRLLLALLYIAVGMWLYLHLGGENLHPFIGIGVFIALMFTSETVCNEGFLRKIKGQSDDQYIDELINHNKAVEEHYEAKEAITFEDLGTGCLCHILNVGNGSSLCLYGQYLYDYSEITDDPDINQERSFPTSKFSLIRKMKNNEVLRLHIGEAVIDEGRHLDVDNDKLHTLGIELKDGEMITDISFAQIKQALL